MRIRTLGLLLVSVVALSACKIQLSSTAGGSIGTQSGNFSCSSGANCAAVDVSNINFDETFVAQPDQGFEFAGWRRRDRGLCGGKTEPCRLFTSGFSGNDILMGFLSDPSEVFYLEAVFQKAGSDNGSGVGHASQCYNNALVAVNSTNVARYRSSSALGEVLITDYDQVITSGGQFNGRSSLKATSNATATGPSGSTSRTISYFQPQPAKKRIIEYGVETEVFTPQASTSTVTIKPQRLDRFDLAPGQSYQQTYTTDIDTRVAGSSFGSSATVTTRTTFLGVESVTVPAGTFQACRFKDEHLDNGVFGSRSDEWFGVGNGLLIKYTEDDISTVLVSASINGADI